MHNNWKDEDNGREHNACCVFICCRRFKCFTLSLHQLLHRFNRFSFRVASPLRHCCCNVLSQTIYYVAKSIPHSTPATLLLSLAAFGLLIVLKGVIARQMRLFTVVPLPSDLILVSHRLLDNSPLLQWPAWYLQGSIHVRFSNSGGKIVGKVVGYNKQKSAKLCSIY